MPRLARLDAAGVLHHVMVRGIEERRIFSDDRDRDNFVGRLAVLIPETSVVCYAWSLMTNHVHLLLRTGLTPLSVFMGRLLTGYAVSFNKRHQRHGQLFQNRYKSVICEEEPYCMELVRYIHLNPLRSHTIPDMKLLHGYPYTGHSAIMGKYVREWQDVDFVLAQFGDDVTRARRNYGNFLRHGLGQGSRTDLAGGDVVRGAGGWEETRGRTNLRIKSDQRILGSSQFIGRILAEKEELLCRHRSSHGRRYTLEEIEEKASTVFLLKPSDLASKTKEKRYVGARSLFCYWAIWQLGYSATEIALRLNMTQPAVTYAVRRGKLIAEEGNYVL